MAAEGGYDSRLFIDDPPKHLECPLCLSVLREPHLFSCCGAHICEKCIQTLREENDAHICPCCRSEDYKTLLNKQLRGQVLSLKVKCQNEGCSWRGELGDLKRHLDTNCVMEEAECKYGCGNRMRRKELKVHEHEECPNLPVSVLVSTVKTFMLTKLDELEKTYKLELDSLKKGLKEKEGSCSEKGGYRQEKAELKDELKQQGERLSRELKEQDEQHRNELSLLRRELKEQDEQHKNELSLLRRELKEKDEQHKNELSLLRRELQNTTKEGNPKVIPSSLLMVPDWLEQPLPISGQVYPPCILTMPNYSQQKKDTDEWFSPPFYTGPGGYRMCLRVRGIGQGSGLGSHVSVFVHLMRSENDDKLKWPLTGEVRVQVVNLREDKNHVELKVPFNDKMLPEARSRVSGRDRALKGIGFHEFVKRDNLSFNVVKNTEYLQNDCISFRIAGVNFFSK